MNGFKIALLAYLAVQVLWVVARIGKERPKITPATAVAGIVEMGILAVLVVLS